MNGTTTATSSTGSTFVVNGKTYAMHPDPLERLLDILEAHLAEMPARKRNRILKRMSRPGGLDSKPRARLEDR